MWLTVEEDEYNEVEATTTSKEEEDDEEDEYSDERRQRRGREVRRWRGEMESL